MPRAKIIVLILLLIAMQLPSNSYSQEQNQEITSIIWSPDGKLIAGSGTQGILVIWDIQGNVLLNWDNLSEDIVAGLAWSPDSTKIVTGGEDKIVKVWNVNDPQYPPKTLIASFSGHEDTIAYVAWSPDGKYIASVARSEYYTLRLWDAVNYQTTPVIEEHLSNLFSVSWSLDGSQIGFASEVGIFVFDDILTIPRPPDLDYHIYGPFYYTPAFTWYHNATHIIAGDYSGRLYLIDLSTGKNIIEFQAGDSPIWALTAHPTENWVVSSTGILSIWDMDSQERLYSIDLSDTRTRSLHAVSWSPDGHSLAYSTGQDLIIKPIETIIQLNQMIDTVYYILLGF
jgi:WD40 repeat protein